MDNVKDSFLPNRDEQIEGMHREFNEIEAVLAEALGYTHDEDYGWVVGDHTPLTLADEIARKYKNAVEENTNGRETVQPVGEPERDSNPAGEQGLL